MTKGESMRRVVAISLALGVLGLAPIAQAHVTLQPSEAPAGEFFRLEVRVPTERDDASTEKVDLQLPDGFLFVSYEPAPGWDIEVTTERLAQPVEVFGNEITEQVSRITFTATSDEAKIAPGQFRDFGLSVRLPERPGATLTVMALQTYDSGEVVRWIGPPDADEPAPQVRLTAAAGEAEAAAAESTHEDDEGTDTVAIIALVVGGLGLLAGGASLSLIARRRTI
jgi:uncharacterized protein YcnI